MLFAVAAGAAALGGARTTRYREHGVDLRLERDRDPRGADLIVAGIGVEPNVELARDAGLEVRSGIVVDERLRDRAAGRLRDRRRRRVLRPALRAPPADRALVERRLPRHDARPDPRGRGRALRRRLVVLLGAVRPLVQVVRRPARARHDRARGRLRRGSGASCASCAAAGVVARGHDRAQDEDAETR